MDTLPEDVLREITTHTDGDYFSNVMLWRTAKMFSFLKTRLPKKEDMMRRAGHGYHPHIKLWLMDDGCIWNSTLTARAVRHGDLRKLEDLLSMYCPWDNEMLYESVMNTDTGVYLWFLRSKRYRARYGRNGNKYMNRLASEGNIRGIKMLKNLGFSYDDNMCYNAVANGHFQLLKYLRRQKCYWDAWTCLRAAEKGTNTEMTEWIRERMNW